MCKRKQRTLYLKSSQCPNNIIRAIKMVKMIMLSMPIYMFILEVCLGKRTFVELKVNVEKRPAYSQLNIQNNLNITWNHLYMIAQTSASNADNNSIVQSNTNK